VPIDDGNASAAPARCAEPTRSHGTYQPLSRPIFIYVSHAAAERPGGGAFVEFYLSEGDRAGAEVGYVPLSDSENLRAGAAAASPARDRLGDVRPAGGSQVGVDGRVGSWEKPAVAAMRAVDRVAHRAPLFLCAALSVLTTAASSACSAFETVAFFARSRCRSS
jgi:hypothetical protein